MPTRRSILKTIGLFLLFYGMGGKLASAEFFTRPKRKLRPRAAKNLFVNKEGKALVGISGNGSVEDMVDEAVSLAGGFKKLALKGKSVLVKPNVVSGERNPATTSPEVVAAVVKALYREGASNVIVGDMSAFRTISTMRNMRRNGIKAAAEKNGAEVVVFEDHGWVEVDLPGNTYVKKALVTEWIFKADLVVNLPVIKTHRSASYSIALKNFIGCTHLKQRPYLIDPGHWEEIIAEFNGAYAPDLNIVDGTVSMIEGGPWEGTPAPTNVIIASGDRVAADAAGLGIIRSFGKWDKVTSKGVWDQTQVKTAIRLGIGVKNDEIILAAGKGGAEFASLLDKIKEQTGFRTV